MTVCPVFPINTHFVHDVCILLRKDHVHGVTLFGEGELAGVLAVVPIAGDFCGFLRFLHVQRASRTPADALEPLVVILLVLVLPNTTQKGSLRLTNSLCKILPWFPKRSQDDNKNGSKKSQLWMAGGNQKLTSLWIWFMFRHSSKFIASGRSM